jgi:hypothetical protein
MLTRYRRDSSHDDHGRHGAQGWVLFAGRAALDQPSGRQCHEQSLDAPQPAQAFDQGHEPVELRGVHWNINGPHTTPAITAPKTTATGAM